MSVCATVPQQGLVSTTVSLLWPAPASPAFAGYAVDAVEDAIIAAIQHTGAAQQPQLLRWAITAVNPAETRVTNKLDCLVTYAS